MADILFYTEKSGATEESVPAMYESRVWIFSNSDICDESKSWATRLTKEGFCDFLAIGALSSQKALSLVKSLFEIKKPLFAIWSFGDSIDNAQVFLSVCKENGVTPVLVTEKGNEKLNAFVIESGEKYIDFAEIDEQCEENLTVAMMAKALTDFPELMTPDIPVRTVTADVMNAENNKISVGLNRVKDGKHLVFTASLDNLVGDAKIIIAHGYYISYGRWFEITEDSISLYSYTSWNETPLRQQFSAPHGLKIKKHLTVIVGADNDNLGNTVTIVTDGGYYTKSGYGWNACDGEVCAMAEGIELKDAKLSWTCVDYSKGIWLIGASYFSLSDPARWPYYLYADKYDKNVFMAGRGGMGGPHGIAELKDALKSGYKPKALAWGVGMNDGSDEGDIKPGYYNALLEVMDVCQSNGILPYIMTIPNTPKQNNSQKLDYIINKKGEFANYDYRVIDIARSIDAHNVGSEWYEGMIHSDQTHPTGLGARAFYLQFMCDFPELMIGGNAKRIEKTADALAAGEAFTVSPEKKDLEEFAFTLSADFDGEYSGKLTLGSTNDGTSYLTVDKNNVSVYMKSGEKDILITRVANCVKMADLVNIRVHVVANKANIALMSAGENVTMKRNAIFSLEAYWRLGDSVNAVSENQELKNVNVKFVNI